MNGPGLGVRLMFWQSTAMHLRRRGTAGGAMASVIYVFLMISIAMAQAQDSAPAESSSAHQVACDGQRRRHDDWDLRLYAPVRALQIPPVSEKHVFAIHVRVSRFSGHLGPRNGTVAPLRRRCAGLGEAIWRDLGKYRIAEIHPDFCPLDDPASGSSLSSFAQENVYFPRVLCRNQSGGHQERQRRERIQHVRVFLGALFASSLENSYYPLHDRTFADTMNRFGGALSSDAITDLLR